MLVETCVIVRRGNCLMKKTLLIILPLLLAGCGGSPKTGGSSYAADYDTSYNSSAEYAPAAYDEEAAEYAREEAAGSSAALTAEQKTAETLSKTEEKIVYTGNINVETTDYAATMTALADLEAKYNAVVTSSDESTYNNNRHYLYLTVRVPSGQFHDFMNGSSVLGAVRNQSINRSDITKAYNDHTIEAEALKIQLTRLQDMLAKAETIEDMLAIEDRLLNVETRLNQLNSVIDNMDMDVAYSTVNITINEVIQYSPGTKKDATFLDRLKIAFEDSWEITRNFVETVLFTLIRYFPVIVILSALYYAFRRWRAAHPRTSGKGFSMPFRKKNKDAGHTDNGEN